ncbi:MAG: hypothetical protein ACI9DO_001992 [Reinekea sp.]|jgi:hypothetical protein
MMGYRPGTINVEGFQILVVYLNKGNLRRYLVAIDLE